MKVAISGKGGVGKTTFASFLIKALVNKGKKVLAIDADPDANLAQALGITESSEIVPISEMKELIEAIYTVRNGHDYFSQSITQLLLKRYVTKIQNNNGESISGIKNLSSREIEIIQLWGNSYTNKEIADKLFISVRTVESHKNHIMQKLNLKTAVDLVKFAIKNNIIEM